MGLSARYAFIRLLTRGAVDAAGCCTSAAAALLHASYCAMLSHLSLQTSLPNSSPARCAQPSCCMLSRAVPIAFSVVGALLLRRRGSGTERRGNERSAGELQATPPRLTRRPPARRLPSRDSGVRARAAALAALVSVLLSVALCWALLYSYTDVHLLQCLAGCNAACAASTAALLVSVSRKRRLTHGRPTTPGDESRRQALTTSELAVVLPRYNGCAVHVRC